MSFVSLRRAVILCPFLVCGAASGATLQQGVDEVQGGAFSDAVGSECIGVGRQLTLTR
jgi:hypothetical protein